MKRGARLARHNARRKALREAKVVAKMERLLRGPRTEWQTAAALNNELLKRAMPSLLLEKIRRKWNMR